MTFSLKIFRPRIEPVTFALVMNLGIHEAQRAGNSLAQVAGLGMDVMECRRPVGPRFLQLLVH